MSLLPSFAQKTIITQTAEQKETSQSLYEWAVDFNNGQFTGQKVNGSEAVKVWIWKCLMTERFRFSIYSWMYGSELEKYIGKALTQEFIDTDVRLALEDALLINPEISSITDFEGTIEKDILSISFTANTIYGAVSILDYRVNEYKTSAERDIERALVAIENGALKFKIENGKLIQMSSDEIDKVVTFSLVKGKLVASMTKEFSEAVELWLDASTGIVKAKYNV